MARKPKRRQTAEDEPTHEVADQAALSESPADEVQLEGEGTLEYTDLVLLVHANNLPEAELFKAELEAHGIPALLEGEGAGVAGIPDVSAGVPVLVPEELANQAAELIAELESAKPEDDDLEYETILHENQGDLEDIDDEDIDELDSLDEELHDDELDDEDDEWDDDEDDEWDDDEDDDWDDDEDDDWEDEDEDG